MIQSKRVVGWWLGGERTFRFIHVTIIGISTLLLVQKSASRHPSPTSGKSPAQLLLASLTIIGVGRYWCCCKSTTTVTLSGLCQFLRPYSFFHGTHLFKMIDCNSIKDMKNVFLYEIKTYFMLKLDIKKESKEEEDGKQFVFILRL